jgi:DNA-binding beta-propeller fold protein YncE
LNQAGETLHVWGSFGDSTLGLAAGGTFNQPWGIAVGPDGTVFVADTWNHRIQTFTPEGEFIKEWGYFGQAEQPEAFWGPRDLAVDGSGRVFITDTGNKRIVVFSSDGGYLTQFGGVGMALGQLDEPVGIAVDPAGLVYVADTWNQRIQVYRENESGVFTAFRSWEVQAWYGQSLENKPYLTVDQNGNLFVSDPESYRILQYSVTGEAIRSWGDFGTDTFQFGLPNGLAAAADGSIWVADSANSRIMQFVIPQP